MIKGMDGKTLRNFKNSMMCLYLVMRIKPQPLFCWNVPKKRVLEILDKDVLSFVPTVVMAVTAVMATKVSIRTYSKRPPPDSLELNCENSFIFRLSIFYIAL